MEAQIQACFEAESASGGYASTVVDVSVELVAVEQQSSMPGHLPAVAAVGHHPFHPASEQALQVHSGHCLRHTPYPQPPAPHAQAYPAFHLHLHLRLDPAPQHSAAADHAETKAPEVVAEVDQVPVE